MAWHGMEGQGRGRGGQCRAVQGREGAGHPRASDGMAWQGSAMHGRARPASRADANEYKQRTQNLEPMQNKTKTKPMKPHMDDEEDQHTADEEEGKLTKTKSHTWMTRKKP